VLIDKDEVIRYLRIKGKADPETERLVDECIKECEGKAKPRYFYRICGLSFKESGVLVDGLKLPGQDIKKHLSGCSKAALMAATLGIEMDRLINFYLVKDIGRSLILDACATAMIEAVCDECQEKIREEAENLGFNITDRFSPGYGDLPIEIQSEFIRVLDTARKIGLHCSQNSILIPRKSVTAIIGLNESSRENIEESRCENCNLAESCGFRKDGRCGN